MPNVLSYLWACFLIYRYFGARTLTENKAFFNALEDFEWADMGWPWCLPGLMPSDVRRAEKSAAMQDLANVGYIVPKEKLQ